MEVTVLWIGVWLVLGPLVGYAIGKPKGREGYGLVLGFLLGFIGWIIVAVMEPVAGYSDIGTQGPRRTCPYCAEKIQPAAVVCRYCGAEVEPALAVTAKGVPLGWRITAEDYLHLQEVYPSEIEDLETACAAAGHPRFHFPQLRSALRDVEDGRRTPQEAVAKRGG